eukprot:3392576-Prymnesium_polylepis.2
MWCVRPARSIVPPIFLLTLPTHANTSNLPRGPRAAQPPRARLLRSCLHEFPPPRRQRCSPRTSCCCAARSSSARSSCARKSSTSSTPTSLRSRRRRRCSRASRWPSSRVSRLFIRADLTARSRVHGLSAAPRAAPSLRSVRPPARGALQPAR